MQGFNNTIGWARNCNFQNPIGCGMVLSHDLDTNSGETVRAYPHLLEALEFLKGNSRLWDAKIVREAKFRAREGRASPQR